MRKLFTMLILLFLVAGSSWAQVNLYSFSSSSGTYTPITGGTVLVTGTSSMDSWASTAQTIPSFTFGGTAYTTAYVTSNGIISLGATAASSSATTGISSTVGSGITICPFSADLDRVNTTAATEIRWETVGNEVIFQWTQIKRYAATESFDMQARLNTSNGNVVFVYQLNSGPGTSTSYQPQVGLRTSSTVYNNRLVSTGTEDWATSLPGTSNSSTCRFTATAPAKGFTSGLTYTFTPPVACVAPLNQPSGLVLTALTTSVSGTFTGVAGSDSYFVVRTPDGVLTANPVNGTSYAVGAALGNGTVVSNGGTSFTASTLTGGTLYYFHVFSKNATCTGGPFYLTTSPLIGSITTAPVAPTSITATAASSTQINLTSVPNAATNDIMVMWTTDNVWGTPSGSYNPGDLVSGGGTVLYTGPAASLPNHTGRTAGTLYYYRAFSIAGGVYSSTYVSSSATTYFGAPYQQNFNASTTLPTGWGGTFSVASPHGTASSNGLYRNLYSSVTTANATSPVVSLPALPSRVMFDYRIVNYTGYPATGTTLGTDNIVIGVSTDGGTNYTAVYTINSSNHVVSNAFANVIVPLTGYEGMNVKVRFLATWGTGDYYVDIDNVAIEEIPSCAYPTALAASGITNNSANIGWAGAATVEIDYAIGAHTAGTGTIVPNVTTNPYPLASLTGNSTYYVYVRQNCGAGNFSTWAGPVTFTTLCDATTSISENFDAVTIPALPSCWLKYTSPSFSAQTVTTVTTLPNSAPNCVQLYSSGATLAADAPLLISPALSNLGAGTHQLKFAAKGNSTNLSVIVGTMSDPANPATFTAFQTITGLNTSTWTNQIVSFASYSGTDHYIAFRHPLTTTYSYVYVDDVVWEPLPTCPQPTALTTANVDNGSADLGWTEAGTATQWEYEIVAATTTPTGSGIVTGSNPVHVTGLTANTSYDFYVRAVCSGEDQSLWTGPKNFHTTCDPITTIPWSENFDAMTGLGNSIVPSCWAISSASGTPWTSGTAASITYNDPCSAPNYVYVSWSPSLADKFLITPGLTLTAGTSYDFKFNWSGDGYSGWTGDMMVNTIQSGTGATLIGTSFVVATTTTTATCTPAKASFTPATSGTYYFMVRVNNNSVPYDLGFDDFSVELSPLCTEPTGVTASAITEEGATLTWSHAFPLPSGGFEYEVRTSGNPGEPTGLVQSGTSATVSKVITGLTPATAYQFYVRSVCAGPDYSIWSLPATFTTLLCNPSNQCNYTVMMTDAYGDGWNDAVLGFRQGGTVVATFGEDFTDGDEFGPVTIPLCDLTSTEIMVLDAGDYPEEVGFVVTDPFGVIVFSRLPGVTFTTSTVFHTFNTNCTPPSCYPPVDLAVSVQTTSALLSWTAGSSPATEWVVEWGEDGFELGTGTSVNVSTTPTTNIPGLTNGTDYEYYVKTVCGVGDESSWAGPKAFRTHYFDCPVGSYTEMEACSDSTNNACNNELPANQTAEAIALGTTICGTGFFDGSLRDTDWFTFTLSATTDVTFTGTADFDILVGLIAAPCPATSFITSATALAGSTASLTYQLAPGTYFAFVAPQFTGVFECGNGDRYQATLTGTTCFRATALTATNIGQNSADISWTSDGSKWNVEYGETGFTLGTGTLIEGLTSPSTTLLGLDGATTYTYYVQTDCDGSTSEWSLPYSFTTLCSSFDLPWSEGFEAVTSPAFPPCWFMENGGWVTVTNPGSSYDADAHTGTKFLRDSWSATDEFVWTPGFNMIAGHTYDFSFWWAGDDYDGWLGDVFYSPTQSSLDAVQLGGSFVTPDVVTTMTYEQETYSFTAPSTGTFYFAIRVNEATGVPWYLSFDDFAVAEQVITDKTLNLKAYVEGLWNGAGLSQAQDVDDDYNQFNMFEGTTADTVSVYLADEETFEFVHAMHAVNLDADGTMTMSIPVEFSGSYYIAIKHRNSVEIWTMDVVDFTPATISYDFTISADQAFGANQQDLNGDGSAWGMYSGDVESTEPGVQDGWIELPDLNVIYNLGLEGAYGYQPADLTGDGFVELPDLNMVYNNGLNGIGKNTPAEPQKRPGFFKRIFMD